MSSSAHHNSTLSHRVPPAREDRFLLSLGKRVRELRDRRGMTRRAAAHDADVSERHLAQLEAGEGNISIVLLRRIAAALNVSLAELFAPDLDEPAQKKLLQRLLDCIPAHRLEAVTFRLMRDFSH